MTEDQKLEIRGEEQRPSSRGKIITPTIEEMKQQTMSIIEDNLEVPAERKNSQSRSNSRTGGIPNDPEKEQQDTIDLLKLSRPSSRTSKVPTPLEELKEQSISLLEDTIGTNLDVGQSQSPVVARHRTFSTASSSGFEQTEPAEWVDNEDEDELMIILDSDPHFGLENVVEEEEEPIQHGKHSLGSAKTPESSVDVDALEQLELQYQLETRAGSSQDTKQSSRPSSVQERPASILKGSREPSGERTELDVKGSMSGSRPASKNSFREKSKQGLLEKKKISFDDDFPFDDQGSKIEETVVVQKSRSQSKERPGSRTSQGSFKGRTDPERKKSASQVPELETIEIPSSLKEKLEQIEQSEPVYKKTSGERQDSPRPPSRPSSTGYTHLDEFERKLAEMETELEEEASKKTTTEDQETETNLVKRENMWNLCGQEGETYDGYFVNQEQELENIDHSFIVAPGNTEEETVDPRSKKVSFAAADERYEIQRAGEVKTLGKNMYSFSPPKPMKKLPTKSQNSIESNDEETPTVGSSKISSKEPSPFTGDNRGFFSSLRRSVSRSKTPETEKEKESESFFGSLLRKGKRGSKSASRQSSVDRDSQELGSELEGRMSRASDAGSENSLVMKLKKVAKKKPKQVSTTDFDELFARGMAMSSGVESEDNPDTAARERKRGVKDNGIGYSEKVAAFLVDQAKNTQITDDIRAESKQSKKTSTVSISEPRTGSRQEKKPIKIHVPSPDDNVPIIMERKLSEYAKPHEIKLSPTTPKRDIFTGEVLPQSPDEEFLARITDFVSNYSKQSYEQAWPASPSKSKERANKKISRTLDKNSINNSPKISENLEKMKKEPSIVNSTETVQDPRNTSQERTFVAEASPMLKQASIENEIPPEFLPSEGTETTETVPVEESDFLSKVSSFVSEYSQAEEYSQKIWPSSPQPAVGRTEKRKKTMSPGKSFIDNEAGDVQWFGRSIEADSYEAQVQVEELDKRHKKNNLSAGAALMRQHLSLAASEAPASPPVRAPPRLNKRSSASSSSETPQELSPLPGKRPDQTSGPPSRQSESRFSNEEFFSRLVVGLQQFATPEPEVRTPLQPFGCSLYKSQSESFLKPQPTVAPEKLAEAAVVVRARAGSEATSQSQARKVTQSMSQLGGKTGQERNAEFYDKLVTGLKDMTASRQSQVQPAPVEGETSGDIYRKYSHHLGRAEFGTLKRRESTGSNSSVMKSPGLARQDSGYDQISGKLPLSRKVSRQDSDEKRMKRGQSKLSDTSEAMPDLEIDDEIESEMLMRIGNIHNRSVTPVAERSSSLGLMISLKLFLPVND